MPTLNIDLQQGFAGDTVEVLIDGENVMVRPDVTSRYTLSIAENLGVEVGGAPVAVEVRVPTRGLARSLTVDATEEPYFGAAIVEGKLELVKQSEPFHYL